MTEIRYGKHDISFYRSHPGRGIFAGRLAVDVYGDNFMPSYTEGDNRNVVATDTMKNFVHAMALEYDGDRYETFALFLGRRFLDQYPQMLSLHIRLREQPFAAHSPKLFSPLHDDYETVELRLDRERVLDLVCGRANLRLVKLTGSAFKEFARDRFTTLPEVRDRPLFIHLDVLWRYRDAGQALRSGPLYASARIRDAVIRTFDDFVSMSIQHLVHEMGRRLFDQFPDLDEVRFEAQNRLWDTVKVSEADPMVKVFADPRPAHGSIFLSLRREPA
ncbi:MAG TPA: urate oxidase [Candidatus Limnocylindrales bacterium]|nr:urate oxidase [Candidatus Limnocylindrales bacterium]